MIICVDHQENILTLLLHQVLLTGKPLQLSRIIHQLFGKDGVFPDLVEVELLLLPEFLQLMLQPETQNDIVAVEKEQPYQERDRGQEVFVQDNVQDPFPHNKSVSNVKS